MKDLYGDDAVVEIVSHDGENAIQVAFFRDGVSTDMIFDPITALRLAGEIIAKVAATHG